MNAELIDATLIIEKKKNKKGFTAWVEINGVKKPFSRFTFPDDSLNGQPCKVDKQLTKVIVNGKTYPPEQKAQNQNNQPRQTNRQPQQTHSQTNNREENNMPDSVNINNTKLPSDTRSLNFSGIDNFSLKLNKAARFDDSDNKFKFYKTPKRRGEEEYCIRENYGNLNFEDFKTKMHQIKTSLESQGYKLTDPISKKPDWRLIVGLGNESVYETSITLHHIYGVPYIPGSAVKGVVRSYVIQQILSSEEIKDRLDIIDNVLEIDSAEFKKIIDNQDKDKLKKLIKVKDSEKKDIYPTEDLLNKVLEDNWEELKQARAIFGNQNDQGKVIFFDAFPIEAPTIEPDIMNPHYGDYYRGEKPPADYLSPNPIFFLTVKDSEFDFYLGMKPKDFNENKDLLGKAENWLKEALTTHGIGAKTAVGYGYFK